MTAGENKDSFSSHELDGKAYAGMALVSAVYFADIAIKASQKCFWFDELFTSYLCRLPDFKATWAAVLHGSDFNSPLLYLFTRWAQWLFGEGLITTRLPAMVGVWLFGLCLFLFVSRRTGVVSGFIAGTFPFFTLVQYYAYEERAHGIVLGWCGLTLVCWQRRGEGNQKNLWLAGFGLCLLGALLTHVYAVYILFPFILVECYNLFDKGRPDWGILSASALALISVTFVVYLPMFRMYRATVAAGFFGASHEVLQRFMVLVIGPAGGLLMVTLALFALEGIWRIPRAAVFEAIPKREMLVAAGFACIPLVGLLGSEVSHGPFIERYFLSSVAGYAIFLGFASSRRLAGSRTAWALAGFMLFLMIGDLGATIYLTKRHRIVLIEPSTGLVLSTTPATPMAMYETVSLDSSGLDILVLSSFDYFYFFRYAPPAVIPHLYYLGPPNDVNTEKNVNFGLFERLAKGAHIDLRTTTIGPFLATHENLLMYGSASSLDTDAIQALASAGYVLKSARADTGGVMYEYQK
jgi:hypothetical protein